MDLKIHWYMEKRAVWFKEQIPVFLGAGGIFARHRPSVVP